MLVARRDPPFDVDGYNVAPGDPGAYRAPKAPRLTRFITVVQMVGSLLAVPVGIASAYSFYRANFSPETTCQSLRSGIVAMLDKSVDATTRRILVRRDVEAFEKTCASVDPDATAAFKTLLAVEKTVTPAVVEPVVPKVQHSEATPKEPVRKVEPRQQAVAKQPAVSAAPVMAEPANRDSAVSDTQWLDAVRQALVTHKSEPPAIEAVKLQPQSAPVVRPVVRENASAAPAATSAVPAATNASAPASAPINLGPPAPAAAPALPPAIAIAPPPAQHVDIDHPVPPQAIPDSIPPSDEEAAKPDEHGRSRIGKWISSIPLLGPAVDNARQ
jgi:hypothetical protein